MFARVQTFHHPAGKLDELTMLAREQVAASRPPGLRDFYFLVDRDIGKALLISLWETEEDVRQLEATNAPTRARVKAEADLEPPLAEIFEVTFHAS